MLYRPKFKFLSFILLAVTALGQRQTKQGASAHIHSKAKSEVPLTENTLRMEGVTSADMIRKIYAGDFAHAGVSRTGPEFFLLFSSFVEAFSRQCSAYLPANKVPMTERYCSDSRTPVNNSGVRVGMDYCAGYSRRPIPDRFAEPEAEKALEAIDTDAYAKMANKMVADMMKNGLPDSTAKIATLGQEKNVQLILQQNGCESPATVRLQHNLTLFAAGGQPIHLGGKQELPVDGAVAIANTDFYSFVNDLIAADAQSWLFNKFDGHISARILAARDSQGRPVEIDATYDQHGGFGSQGSVRITFADGVPACLYFADAATTCGSPDQRIVTAYLNGAYYKQAEPAPAQPPLGDILDRLEALRRSINENLDPEDLAVFRDAMDRYMMARKHKDLEAQRSALSGLLTLENKYNDLCRVAFHKQKNCLVGIDMFNLRLAIHQADGIGVE